MTENPPFEVGEVILYGGGLLRCLYYVKVVSTEIRDGKILVKPVHNSPEMWVDPKYLHREM